MSTLSVLNFSINTSLEEIEIMNEKKLMINTINPHSYNVTRKDGEFKKALQESDILTPDGVGIVWAIKILTGKRIKRIAGADLHQHLLELANKQNAKVFYMGSANETLQKIKEKVKKEYPNVIVSSYSPPYKPEFTKEDNKAIVNAVNAFQPDVLFVGMTAPKQEKWSYQHKDQLDTNVIASIGAVFDFYAETIKRPPNWLITIRLEWLGRLLKEPKRMWRRIFISTPIFIFDVLKEKYNFSKKIKN